MGPHRSPTQLGGALNQGLISVVLIFLDECRFLAEAIDSVFRQTDERWELLLVDDGSTDGSSELARETARRHPDRVCYLEHEGHANREMSASRNVGIEAAHGEYVAFLDGDDVWLPHKLARQRAILESRADVGLVYGATTYWHSWRGGDEYDLRSPLGVEPNRTYSPPYLLVRALRSRTPTACPSDIMMRRALALEVGGFDESILRFQDQAFLAKIYLREPVYVAGDSWFLYRQHDASAVARMAASGDKYEFGLSYFNWLERYLVAHRVDDRAVWRALRQKRLRYAHPAYDRLFRAALRAESRLRGGGGWEQQQVHGALER